MALTVQDLHVHEHVIIESNEWEIEWINRVPFPTLGLVDQNNRHTFIVCSPRQTFIVRQNSGLF